MIVKALAGDRKVAAKMIYETMGEFGDAALGIGSRELAIRAIEYFFGKQGNRFSLEVTWLIKKEKTPTGVLVAYPGVENFRRNLTIGWQLWQVYGLVRGMKLIWNSAVVLNTLEAQRDEFYISHIAVGSEFRRQGIAHELMGWAEDLARKNGLKKCSLVVDIDNAPALALYRALGYKVVETSTTPKLEKTFHTRGQRRMVKNLTGGQLQ
jgi:ribosomal protein S18 acetylase RimI-like enzyme